MPSARKSDISERLDSVRETLIRADSIMSLIVHRYPTRLPGDIVAELAAVYVQCRHWAKELPVED
jgi:hypothetical protein